MWWQRVKQHYAALRPIREVPVAVMGRDGKFPIRVFTCTLFYSYFRLHATIETVPVFGASAVTSSARPAVRLLIGGTAPKQQTECRRLADGQDHEFFIDALVDPARFPGDGVVEFT